MKADLGVVGKCGLLAWSIFLDLTSTRKLDDDALHSDLLLLLAQPCGALLFQPQGAGASASDPQEHGGARSSPHAYIEASNEPPKPFIWTKTADHVLASVARFCARVLEQHIS